VTGLDTNVLVRYLTKDDLPQVEAVDRLIQDAREAGEFLFVSVIVLCELCWVLSYSYELKKDALVAILDDLLISDVLEIERLPLVTIAVAKYRAGRAGFADYLIGEVASAAGCTETVTFDRKLKGSAGYRLL